MPTYSYRCTDCSTAFDIQQAFTDDSLTVCPSCEGRLRKVFSAVGVTFNGSGFYRTDSRSGTAATGGKGSEKSGDSGSGSTGSGDTGAGKTGSGNAKAATAAPSTSAPAAAPAAR